MAKPTIGFIGIGIMGEPMVRNLLKAGFSVNAFSRTKARADGVCGEGAKWQATPARVAQTSEIIISMLPDSPDVEAVYLADDGMVAGLNRGALCIDMSTVSPDTARKVAAAVEGQGGRFLDAPVSGGKTGAEAGKLAIMAGGDAADVERAQPVFEALGKVTIHCGPVGYGQLTKLCNQILCGLNLLAVCEATVFARKVGLDPKIMLQATSSGAAGSWALENLGSRMIARDFAPMFMIDLQQKDLRIALDAAQKGNTPLPGTALVNQLLAANQAMGEGREGTQALVKTLERLARLA